MKIRFSYPTHIVPPKSRIVIYGAGNNGQMLFDAINESQIYAIIGIVDSRYVNDNPASIFELSPEWLRSNTDYDFIVISVADKSIQKEIKESLYHLGIDNKKIVTIDNFYSFDAEDTTPIVINELNGNSLNICLFSKFCGLGDQIITLGLYKNLTKLFTDCIIDIWSEHVVFSKSIFYGQDNLGEIIDCRDDSFARSYSDYDLFIEVSFEILIKEFNKAKIASYDNGICKRIEKQIEFQQKNYVDSLYNTYSDLILAERAKMIGTNRFGLLKGYGLFDEIDETAEVLIPEDAWLFYDELNMPTKYITFSYGANGVGKGTKTQTKMWISEYYTALFEMIKNFHPDIDIIQLGDEKANKIEGADRYILGENLDSVKCILKKSLIHIDCEGGITHLASHLGTKCIVLFGPTPEWFYGYKNNINISSTKCRSCMGISRNYQFECMKYDRPECMYSITPDIVYNEFERFIESIE